MLPFAKQGDPTLKLLCLLQEQETEQAVTQGAVDTWVNSQLRGGSQVRDILSVIKSLKRQLPAIQHVLFQNAPIPSTSLLRLPSLLPTPTTLITKKALMQALSKGADQKYITLDQATEILLLYAWGKLRREGDGDACESVERVAKKMLEIEAELEVLRTIPTAIQSAINKVRFDVGFVTLKHLVSRINTLALSDSNTTKPKRWLEAWLSIRLSRPSHSTCSVGPQVTDARMRLRTELNQIRTKLPVTVRPILDSLDRRHELNLSSKRSRHPLGAPHLNLDQRRPSLPILTTTPKLDAQLLNPAAASTTDVASYLRSRRLGSLPGGCGSTLSLNSIPQYSTSQSSGSPSNEIGTSRGGDSPMSFKRALRLPQHHDPMPSPLPSPLAPHQSSPLSLKHALSLPLAQEPLPSPSLAPPPRSHSNSPRTSPKPTLRLFIEPAGDVKPIEDIPHTASTTAPSTPKQSSSLHSHGSPISFKRALELREKHDEPMPELTHPFAQRDRSISVYMPQEQERTLAPVESHRPTSIISSQGDGAPSPTSTAHIEFATREFAFEARAIEFELPLSRRPSEVSLQSHLDMGERSWSGGEPRRSRTLRRKKHRRPSADEHEGLLELSRAVESHYNAKLQAGILRPALSADSLPSCPPRSPTSPDSCYSQTSYIPTVKRSATTILPTIPPSPLFSDDFGQTLGLSSPTYRFPAKSPTSEDTTRKGGRRRGLMLPKLPFRSRLASLDSNAQRVASGIKSFDQAQRDAFLGDLSSGDAAPRASEDSIRTLERIITPYFLPPTTPMRGSSLHPPEDVRSTIVSVSSSSPTFSTLAPVFELFTAGQTAERPSPKKVQSVLLDFVRSEKVTVDGKGQEWEIEKHRILWLVEEAERIFHEPRYVVVFEHVRFTIEHLQKILPTPEAPVMPAPSPSLARISRRPATAPTRSSPFCPTSPAHTFGCPSNDTPRRPSLVPRRSGCSDDSVSTDWTQQAVSAPGTPSSVRSRQLGAPITPTSGPALVLRTATEELDRITERSTLSSHDGHEAEASSSPVVDDQSTAPARIGPLPGRWSSDSTIGVTAKEAPPSYWDSMTPIDSE